MRASLEVRTPYLSRDLYNLLSKIDPRAMIAFGRKKIIYDILSRYIPETFINRAKQGFIMPLEHYFRQHNLKSPNVPGVKQSVIESIWNNYMDKNYQHLAFRLDLLSHAFQTSAMA